MLNLHLSVAYQPLQVLHTMLTEALEAQLGRLLLEGHTFPDIARLESEERV